MKPSRSVHSVFLASFILSGFFLAGCDSGAPNVDGEARIRPVKLDELVSRRLEMAMEMPGQIQPNQEANLSFEVPGVVRTILVAEGQRVEAGKVLAELNPLTYEIALDAARAQLEVAKQEADRARLLFEREATTQQQLDLAVSNQKVAQANYDNAEKALNDTKLVAPFSGIIAKIFIEDVVNVQPNQTILVIHDNSSLKLKVDFPETMAATARPGIPLDQINTSVRPELFLTVFPDRRIPARFVEYSTLIDDATRTFEAVLEFEPPTDMVIFPGMTAVLVGNHPRDLRGGDSEFAVPASAVVTDAEGQAYILATQTDSMTVERFDVDLGAYAGDEVEVFSDRLTSGLLVVTSGVNQLQPGDRVRRWNP